MTKRFLLLVVGLLTMTAVFAQRLTDERIVYNFKQLPLNPLEGDFKTYAVLIDKGGLNLSKLGTTETALVKNYFELKAYERVASEGDFLIVVTLSGDQVVSKEAKTKTVTEGKGEAAKKVTKHYYEVKYRTPISYQILDGKRQIMRENDFAPYGQIQTKEFGTYNSKSAMLSAWRNKGNASLEAWIKEAFTAKMQQLRNHLASSLDTRPVKADAFFYSIKKPEKIGAEDLAATFEGIEAILAKATPDEPVTIADFGDRIDIWKAAFKTGDPKDKKKSIAFQAAGGNLAGAYMAAGEYGNAEEILGRLKACKYRDRVAFSLKDRLGRHAARAKANLNVPQTYVSSFDADAHKNYMASRSGTVQEVAAPESGDDDYLVLLNQDTLHGMLTYDMKKPKLGEDSELLTLKGVTVTQADGSKRYVKPNEFMLASRLGKTELPVTITMGPVGIMTIQEYIDGTDDLILTRLESEGGDYAYFLSHMITKKNGKKGVKVYSLTERLSFGSFSSYIAKKFEGHCSVIVNKAKKNAYKENETSYREIVRDYEACNR